MNVEFHYYSTAFLAVKAGFSAREAAVLGYAGQYVDHHNRTMEIQTPRGTVLTRPTQTFSFWDPATVASVLAPFHFFPAGAAPDGSLPPSVRSDGGQSAWDVRPNSPGVKTLLVDALKSKDLYRIGVALHTYSDTWAHQNFSARDEAWNRLDPTNRLPAPGHAQAGIVPDLWLGEWDDPRLTRPRVVNRVRFAEAAAKIYRYLCTFRGKDFKTDEQAVAEELEVLVLSGRDREALEDRVIDYVLTLDLEPYDRNLWISQALELPEEMPSAWPLVDHWKKLGQGLLDKTGLKGPQKFRAKPGFESSAFAAWVRAAEAHRALAKTLIKDLTGGLW